MQAHHWYTAAAAAAMFVGIKVHADVYDDCGWAFINQDMAVYTGYSSMSFHEGTGTVARFGGEWRSGTCGQWLEDVGTMWTWNGATWARYLGTQPPARTRAGMVYDAARDRLVLFGGSTVEDYWYGPPLGDTWEWDGTAWEERPVVGPPAQSGHAMAYDRARQRTVLFGRGSTWEWDGTEWTHRTDSGPGQRSGCAMAYDEIRRRVVLFGGSGMDDTWEWDGTSWALRAVVGPDPRSWHSMCFDSWAGRVTLFGGRLSTDGCEEWAGFDDTWQWDGTSWTRVPECDPRPAAREGSAMAFDRDRGVAVLTGGALAAGGSWMFFADTWELPSEPPLCRADINGDGVVDTRDVLQYLGAWVLQDPSADWNRDGTINTIDFLAFLNDWAAGC